MDLNKAQDVIIDEFEILVDTVKNKFRYLRHLAELGAKPTISAIERTNEKLIRLTKSRIWLDAEYKDGKVFYYGDSDSKIIRAIVQLYVRVFSGRTPGEIINSNIYFTDEISLHNNLSPERRSELSALLQKIRAFAVGYKLKSLETGQP